MHVRGIRQFVCMCVYMYLSVTKIIANCYIPRLYVKNEVSWDSLWCFPGLLKMLCSIVWCHNFADHYQLPFSLPNEFSMDKRDSSGFLSAHTLSDSSYNIIDQSLIIAHTACNEPHPNFIGKYSTFQLQCVFYSCLQHICVTTFAKNQ